MHWQRDTTPAADARYEVFTLRSGVIATAPSPEVAGAAWATWRDQHPRDLQPVVRDAATHQVVTQQAIEAWVTATGRDTLPAAKPELQQHLQARVESDLVDGLRVSFLNAAHLGAERRHAAWTDATTTEVSMRLIKALSRAEDAPLERLVNDGWQVLYACGYNHGTSIDAWRNAAASFVAIRNAWKDLFSASGERPKALVLERPQLPERVIAAVDQRDGLVLPVLRRPDPSRCWHRLSETWKTPREFATWREYNGLTITDAA